MIIIRVELHSARTGQVTELARMKIANSGGDEDYADYDGYIYRGRSKEQLDKYDIQRQSTVKNYARKRQHVWNLVTRMLINMGYR